MVKKIRAKKRLRVGVVGATGVAGQQFLAILEKHPWFQLRAVAASAKSAGQTLGQALRDPESGAMRWWAGPEPPKEFLPLQVTTAEDMPLRELDLVFSAVETDAARELEKFMAEELPVFSTASAYRMEDDIPLMIAGVNPEQTALVSRQKKNRGWKGYIVPIPNCTVTGLAIVLKGLDNKFGVRSVVMTSIQALSGAGRNGGVLAIDAIDNLIPYIPNEEEKVQREAGKILGQVGPRRITPHKLLISATCTRGAILDGHFESLSIELLKAVTPKQAEAALSAMKPRGQGWGPSMPDHMIRVHRDPFRPQPRRDRDEGYGMVTSVGRIRPEPLFGKKGLKLVLLSHNTQMGAARGSVALAEYFVNKGFV